MLSTFGIGLFGGSRPDYDDYCQLFLNLPRALAAKSWAVAEGIKIALSSGSVPFDFTDAVSRTEIEALALQYQLNASRYAASKLTGSGWE